MVERLLNRPLGRRHARRRDERPDGRGWLDAVGSPLTSAGKLTERFRRLNYGSLDLTVTIDDPKAYTKPFTADVHYHVMLDTQLIEFVCIDKDAAHYVAAGK